MGYRIRQLALEHVEVRLEGALVVGTGLNAVRQCLLALAAEFPRITVDLAGVTQIDLTGVRLLMMAHGTANTFGHRMWLQAAGAVSEFMPLARMMIYNGDRAPSLAA